jgi:hypothetical protein
VKNEESRIMKDGREAVGRRLPWGFLGMLGLVMAIEFTLAGHDLDFTAVWHWDWRIIGKAATKPDKVRGKDVLIFGDSMIKFGLMPKVLKQGSGKTVYNFALHTGQTSSSYFMLRRTLRAGARPSAIVLDVTPHMLMHHPDVNKNLWAELLTVEECLDFSQAQRDPRLFAHTMLEKTLTSYKERYEIRASLLAAVSGTSTSRRLELPSYWRNWKLNDGAQLMGYIGAPSLDPDFWVRSLYSKWDPDPVNVAYLDRFLALAAEHEITVYWLLPPLHPDVQYRTDANRFDLDYSTFVKATQSRFPGTIVVDSRHSGFTPEMFLDGAHANRIGALKLSAAMAEVLKRPADSVPPSRWVNLDLAKVQDFQGPIEDVNQSIAALKDGSAETMRR